VIERILVVGLGSIGKRHARIARMLLPNARIVALRRSCVSLAALPEGVDAAVCTMSDALDFAPQIAIIASPSSAHIDIALALAKRGTHLLVEKPISASVVGVHQLIQACEQRRLTLMTGYNLRFQPTLDRFRTLLNDGCIGRVCSVRAEVGQFLPDWRPGTDFRSSVSARSDLGGGALLELSHEFDYLRWIFGDVAWISAVILRQGGFDIDVEDTAHVTMGFHPTTRGAIAPVAQVNLDFVRRDTTRNCTAIGENGTLHWDAVRGVVTRFDAATQQSLVEIDAQPGRDETYVRQLEHFIDCAITGGDPRVSGRDGLAALLVVEAARLSSAHGGVVVLDQTLLDEHVSRSAR
jgi:predicted dehydrogenase